MHLPMECNFRSLYPLVVTIVCNAVHHHDSNSVENIQATDCSEEHRPM
jgi:hypothetical protein